MREKTSDGALVIAVKDCGNEAAEALYEKYTPHLRRFIPGLLSVKGCVNVNAHAEGVTSDVWISALGKLDTLKNPDSFQSWLTVIAANAVRKHLRGCIRAQRHYAALNDFNCQNSLNAEIQSDQHVVDAAIDAVKIFEIAQRISTDFATVLYLHFWEELDFHEIANILNMPYASARTLFYRNKQKVHEFLMSLQGERKSVQKPRQAENRDLDHNSLKLKPVRLAEGSRASLEAGVEDRES